MSTAARSCERLRSRGLALPRLAAVAAGAVLCLAAGVSQAQSGKGEYLGVWSVSGGLGYAVPNTDAYDNSLAWRVAVGYSMIPQLEADLEVGGFSSDVSQPEPDGVPVHDIASGRLDVLPVCLTLQYRTPLPAQLATFVLLAGAGYYFVDYTMADTQRDAFVSSGVEGLPDQSVSDAWGFHAGAGLEYALAGWLSVTIEGRYVFLAPGVSGTTKDGYALDGSLDLNTWLFTGGIKVAF